MNILERIAARWLRSRGWTVVQALRYEANPDQISQEQLRACSENLNATLADPRKWLTHGKVETFGPFQGPASFVPPEVAARVGHKVDPVCFSPENWVMRPVGEPRQ